VPDLLGRLLLALLLTLAVEAGVAWLFGFRTGRSQLTLALINVITNPLLNLLLLVLAYLGVQVTLLLVTLLEIPVVLAEWGLLVCAFGGPKGRRLALSLAANAASFLIGLLVFWI
jgi:hypothetical protein